MNAVKTLLFILLIFCTPTKGYAEGDKKEYLAIFWNVENFLDPFNQEVKPGWRRFNRKRDEIAKCIVDVSNGEFPLFIALAEVESSYALYSLAKNSMLSFGNYGIVHKDSPDRRGIDVGLLYSKNLFKLLESKFLSVQLDKITHSRDILYCKGVIEKLDTIHVIVCHWPSRFGGEKKTSSKRVIAAEVLKNLCDSILTNRKANILVMGDFNDTYGSESFNIIKCLNHIKLNGRVGGTIKYRGAWEYIDHFFVSDNLLNKDEPISVNVHSATVLSPSYLLERDFIYTGFKPKRWFIGPRYNGGISDHLPIILTIERNW